MHMTMQILPPVHGSPPRLRCYNPACGHTWVQRGDRPPQRCPRCQSRHWYNPSYPFTHRRPPRPPEPQAQSELPLPQEIP